MADGLCHQTPAVSSTWPTSVGNGGHFFCHATLRSSAINESRVSELGVKITPCMECELPLYVQRDHTRTGSGRVKFHFGFLFSGTVRHTERKRPETPFTTDHSAVNEIIINGRPSVTVANCTDKLQSADQSVRPCPTDVNRETDPSVSDPLHLNQALTMLN
jgi:hypothetical protein